MLIFSIPKLNKNYWIPKIIRYSGISPGRYYGYPGVGTGTCAIPAPSPNT
jgi:hypothetical protein